MTDRFPSAEVMVRDPEIMQQALDAYIQHKAGPFVGAPTITGFASLEKIEPDFKEAKAHIRSLIAEYAKENPKSDPAGRNQLLAQQLLDNKEAVCQLVALPTGFNVQNADDASKIFPLGEDGMWLTIGCCSTRSLSRGSIHVASSDPTAYPTIDPCYFEHPLDIDMAARGFLHAMSLLELEPIRSAVRREEDGTPVIAKCTEGKFPKTLEQAKEFVQGNTVTEYHPIGTCAMLPREKGGVVDEKLLVYGTTNVRVVDASIFPTHVQGNIVSLVYAVAEKGADLIKEDDGVKSNGQNGVNGHS